MENPWRIFVIIFLARFVSVIGNCGISKYNKECICSDYNSFISMECPPTENDNSVSFSIKYVPHSYVLITCLNDPSWSQFRYEIHTVTQGVKDFAINNCSLKENVDVNEIAKLVGAENVQSLTFSNNKKHNKLTLKKDNFRGFPNVTRLTISDNNITKEFEEDLLEYLPQLFTIVLRSNGITSIPKNFFQNVPNLTSIELGNNKIEKFTPGTFRNLKNLKLLNLWNNELMELDENLFSDLVSLQSLDLHNNRLVTLPYGLFDNLVNLEVVNLSGGPLESLPNDLFQKNKKLTTVKFRMQRKLKTLPSGLFSNCTSLTRVHLDTCNLESIPEDLFHGSTQLQVIYLNRNSLKTLPIKIFDGLKKLDILYLNHNKMEELPDNIFSSCDSLSELYLNNNYIKNISGNLFRNLLSLQKLYMQYNYITNIESNAFTPLNTVQAIDLSYNNITELKAATAEYGVISVFHGCKKLSKLNLSHNKIKLIFSDWIVTPAYNFSYLDLSHNQIQLLMKEDLDFKHLENFELNLSYNNITTLDLSGDFEKRFQGESRSEILLQIQNNPIACDCFLYDFIRYSDGSMNKTVRNKLIINVESLECSSPTEFRGTPLTSLKSKYFTCTPSKYDRYDDISLCPKSCSQLKKPYDKTLIFDCSNRQLRYAPETLCSLANSKYFNEVNLAGNNLTTIPDLNKPGYRRTKTLLLSKNKIRNIPSHLRFPPALQTLEIHDNKIDMISRETLQQINSSLQSITLGGNPWKCNCDSRDFQYFIQSSKFFIKDVQNVICDNSDEVIKTLTVNELCPMENKLIISISVLIAFLGLAIGGMAAAYYNYKNEIKVWLYAHQICLWLVTEEELDKDKTYDAFISYSHKDEDFVINELVTKLEYGPRAFKLCLHFRDWLAGEWIPHQITNSVENSKRTIVVVSPNFVESEWGRLEFRAAHAKALKEKRIRVIVILYGGIDVDDIQEPELKAYLSMNTFVKWGDPWFWDKLRYALPHKPNTTNTTPGLKMYKKQHPSSQLSFNQKQMKQFPESGMTPLNESLNKKMQNGSIFIEMSDDESKKLNSSC